MEQHPRIELGFQVYETCTSPFMFMLQKLASSKGYSLPSLAAEYVLTLHYNLSKMAESRGADPQRFYSSACFQDMFRALTDLLSIYYSPSCFFITSRHNCINSPCNISLFA